MTLALILPASNEARFIAPCLEALLAQDAAAGRVLVVVAANACRDQTAEIARSFAPAFAARGWQILVDESPLPGKLAALNRAEALVRANLSPPNPSAPSLSAPSLSARQAEGGEAQSQAGRMEVSCLYLDADVICDPALLGQVRQVLERPEPAYATGTLTLARAQSRVTRAYGRLWRLLPFVTGGAVGAGFFGVNPAGRARWGAFPDIISDDTFVRLHFAPGERHEVAARYHWPLVEGLGNLVRVRRRQDAGVAELRRLYPQLTAPDPAPPRLWPLFRAEPLGFAVYALVRLAVRLRPATRDWSRGR